MNYPHLLLPEVARPERFISRRTGREPEPPKRDQILHGKRLKSRLEQAWLRSNQERAKAVAISAPTAKGTYLEFKSDPGTTLFIKSLHSERGIQLRTVKIEGNVQYATVFVPDKKRASFLRVFDRYLTERTKSGNPKHLNLVNSIADISIATLESLWTDSLDIFPESSLEVWWEVWLHAHEMNEEISSLKTFADANGIEIAERYQSFPDRTIVLLRATREQLAQSLLVLDAIAELRKPKSAPSFFRELGSREGLDWANDLLSRTRFVAEANSPVVCILDTGVNRTHPLLAQSLSLSDMHSYRPEWKLEDHEGHGTEMAGLAIFGDLTEHLEGTDRLEISHRLESVKILPPVGDNDPKLYGCITSASASLVEIQSPSVARSYCLAITSSDNLDRGRPSAWSAELDKLSGGFDGVDSPRRLYFVSAGNGEPGTPSNYLDNCRTQSIQDPGQAWNAITVGSFTERTTVAEALFDGWSLVAARGSISPVSTTSCVWSPHWPIKPEIVMEGGNYVTSPDELHNDRIPSLSLITTYFQPNSRLFEHTGDTSAAVAQAARLSAKLSSKYPDLWTETIRALMIHSARWTDHMKAELGSRPSRSQLEFALRTYGFGAPQFDLALESKSNNLTIIREGYIQPFNNGRMNHMDLVRLPWPKELLLSLGETPVKLRVTLSYFIEPNPGEKGHKYKHRYASHGLRFDLNTPYEEEDDFRKRINRAAWQDESEQVGASGSEQWLYGPEIRSKGSIHTDVWEGTAADLANRFLIGIYPVGGWWKEQPKKNRWQAPSRYSLLVGVETPALDLDLYVAIKNEIEIQVLALDV